MIIGLGNDKSTPDSLGPLTIEKIIVTNHIYLYGDLEKGFRRVCAISPGVMGLTGIETSDLIKEITKTINISDESLDYTKISSIQIFKNDLFYYIFIDCTDTAGCRFERKSRADREQSGTVPLSAHAQRYG